MTDNEPVSDETIMQRVAFMHHLNNSEHDRCLSVLKLLGDINYGRYLYNSDNRYKDTCAYYEGKVHLIKKDGSYGRSDDSHVLNPLLSTIMSGKINNVKFLVEMCNADINHLVQDNEYNANRMITPIMYAFKNISSNLVDIILYLLEKGAKIEIENEKGDLIKMSEMFNKKLSKEYGACYLIHGYGKLFDNLLNFYIKQLTLENN
ncbi:MAG: hypothetical protein EOP34_07040 [Rickettsiales bacterium]|nr:MAG: hypothetical protein EOP34_07040 [Rickettsiales bacterium]